MTSFKNSTTTAPSSPLPRSLPPPPHRKLSCPLHSQFCPLFTSDLLCKSPSRADKHVLNLTSHSYTCTCNHRSPPSHSPLPLSLPSLLFPSLSPPPFTLPPPSPLSLPSLPFPSLSLPSLPFPSLSLPSLPLSLPSLPPSAAATSHTSSLQCHKDPLSLQQELPLNQEE